MQHLSPQEIEIKESVQGFYQSFLDNEDNRRFFHFFNKAQNDKYADKVVLELVKLSLDKKDEKFFSYWIDKFSLNNLLSLQNFPFFEILEKYHQLITGLTLNEENQEKHYDFLQQHAQDLSYLKFPERKTVDKEIKKNCQRIEMLICLFPKQKKMIIENLLIHALSSPHLSIIQTLEKHIDLNDVKNQQKIFYCRRFLASIDFDYALPEHSRDFHREKFLMEILDHYQDKWDLLKAQNSTVKQLMWDLCTDSECVEKWYINYEQYNLKNYCEPGSENHNKEYKPVKL